ncbi:hypothetical protein DEO72_LG6g766 [Vigna unguiculata]|uniref:Uncharacterized protein n=1 Tax=Vigna unguiculata TaxID=3917 RepID=A0A4D6M884_VIGUN|nr:hypothetical protein DEO72_LG6g766 [Vigna unguiculata]
MRVSGSSSWWLQKWSLRRGVQFVKEDGEGVLQIRVEMVRCRSAFMLQWRFCRFAFLSPHTRGSSQQWWREGSLLLQCA